MTCHNTITLIGQDPEEHARTAAIAKAFQEGEGQKWQRKLEEYNEGVDSYIEEWWCKSTRLSDPSHWRAEGSTSQAGSS